MMLLFYCKSVVCYNFKRGFMAIYILSDIHGRKDKFFNMIQLLNLTSEDQVYILGDVIDRGEHGIEILQYIKNQPNFTLLMGNHEHMMIQYFENKGKDDFFYYEAMWFQNGCSPTLFSFENLKRSEQEEILLYLQSLPLAIPNLIVNDKSYYLVHATPLLKSDSKMLYLKDVNEDECRILLWNRNFTDFPKIKGQCVICGHTMTSYYQNKIPCEIYVNTKDIKKAEWINIDCGCAANRAYNRLAALCLDTLQVYYV